MSLQSDSWNDVIIIGAGAAGLMAGITAARAAPHRKITLLDGAKKPGAKLLVAGGGRCNVTHEVVEANQYAGSSHNAIRKVLRRFDVPQTIHFFREIGVELKTESTGKLFPVTDDAHTVLNALLNALQRSGAGIRFPYRVERIERCDEGFRVHGDWGTLSTRKLILATGGKSLPKSGSDGQGYTLAQSLGHTITERVYPALTPLLLPTGHFLCDLSGITVPAALTLYTRGGAKRISFTGSMLCTHFGLSGPCVLDISRYYIDAAFDDPQGTVLTVNWLPEETPEQFDRACITAGNITAGRFLSQRLPERLARALVHQAGLPHETPLSQVTRAQRTALVEQVTHLRLPISGHRGFTYAEVTAGGVPLSELRLDTMESRSCGGLYFCGEICDVDGRIGGFNFQWAWSSGYVAGTSA